MNKQSAFINEESDEKIVKENEEEILKELKRKRNCERQRAYYQRQKDLKKNEKKIKIPVPKSNAERQRKFRQRNAEKSYVDMKTQKLDSNEENVVQCRAVENIENVTLQENQFHSQQLQIYEYKFCKIIKIF
ncbi:uncharacterized protein LOC141536905 [Cotesia typhae]|uniref:uncharacterized protein LOC141536905 n=1 Tax=Cotesia typhae TaxID=2053667 RepID=UPI003D6833AE